MPHLNCAVQTDGPIIRIGVLPSTPRADALRKEAKPVPSPVMVSALIDTGASSTMVDAAVIARLGVPPRGVTHIGTPSTGAGIHECYEYDVAIAVEFDDGGFHVIDSLPVVEVPLAQFGFEALLGRDILEQAILIYNGGTATLSLSF